MGVLHQRLRRLSLLLELSEPGEIPEPSLLASLISVVSAWAHTLSTCTCTYTVHVYTTYCTVHVCIDLLYTETGCYKL